MSTKHVLGHAPSQTHHQQNIPFIASHYVRVIKVADAGSVALQLCSRQDPPRRTVRGDHIKGIHLYRL